ncbi:efflux RND transporter periplasmic adaptor subunit [Phaeobacter sp.]|uniref:efflux RND transporter periplasmic adaptor subunit n=1 Tax=Phaeobacter sp. TaxID=1902409 RepID=UPI0025FD43E9|nr:efflux RND transporter periplasmic adaptor subunit [Phaeobacter sp.]
MSEPSPSLRRRWLWICLSAALLAAVVVVLFETEDTIDVARNAEPAAAPAVTVLEVARETAAARIEVFAELRPLWKTEIRAAVAGRIVEVHDAALAGTRVEAGAVLFELERVPYEAAVAAAEMGVQEAKLALLRAENDVTVAQRQFERSGETPPNELALRLPERRIAERALASAQARLTAARQQLDDTRVTAPFAGFVTERMASLGQTVGIGEPLLTLSDDQHFELVAELSQKDWSLLQHPIAGGQADIWHRDGRHLGVADIRQGGGFLDPTTRQMRVYLEVKQPQFDALAGDFLRVEFAGRPMADTLTVPETAMSRAGVIWMVGADDLLVRHKPQILFRTQESLTLAAPDGPGPWRIARTPLASFLPGQLVRPQMAEE